MMRDKKNNWKETIQILKRKGYSIKEICDLCIISPFSEEEIKNILNTETVWMKRIN